MNQSLIKLLTLLFSGFLNVTQAIRLLLSVKSEHWIQLHVFRLEARKLSQSTTCSTVKASEKSPMSVSTRT